MNRHQFADEVSAKLDFWLDHYKGEGQDKDFVEHWLDFLKILEFDAALVERVRDAIFQRIRIGGDK